MDILAFIIGGFIGTVVGIGIICLCTIAKRADESAGQMLNRRYKCD